MAPEGHELMSFIVRPGTPADHPLVYNATARSMHGSAYHRDIEPEIWTAVVNALIGARLRAPGWQLLVSHPIGYTDEIAGFILCKPGVAVTMLYVKNIYRRMGVARQLLQAAQIHGHALAVLGSPKAFKLAREKGLELQLSPSYL